MSSSVQAPSRALLQALKPGRRRPLCECSRFKRLPPQSQQYRSVSSTATNTTTSEPFQSEESSSTLPSSGPQVPRWSQTPPAMKAPVRTRPKPAGWKPFEVNNDPEKLNGMYSRLLGKNGPKMLSDETKWLAVTHKSFDHGRRGFNDRLSYLGKRIVELQTSLALLNTKADVSSHAGAVDQFGREIFSHPATQGVEILNTDAKDHYMSHVQIAGVAAMYDLPAVVRWQPRDVRDLGASGAAMVYAQALYAIVGALALEQGGVVANKVVRERILHSAGLRSSVADSNAAA